MNNRSFAHYTEFDNRGNPLNGYILRLISVAPLQ